MKITDMLDYQRYKDSSMKTINLVPGSPSWLVAMTASKAPAMMGADPNFKRDELLRQFATGISIEVNEFTQRIFDNGHALEAMALPLIEEIIGDELFSQGGMIEVEGLKLYANFDGLTLTGDKAAEHKQWNAQLAPQIASGIVAPYHYWQLEQEMLVADLDRILLVMSNGTREQMVSCWYDSQPERRAKLIAGWKQFAADLETYQPEIVNVAPVGRAPETLPALHVEVTGMVTASNLAEFKASALAVFSGIRTELVTDSDFADAEKTVKWCKEVEDRLEATKQHALSQTASIDELFRTMDDIKEEARVVRLKLEKIVKAEKENRKTELVVAAKNALIEHVAAMNDRIGGAWMPPANGAQFSEAIKGLKSLDSMRDKIGAALANAKIEASAMADRIEANRRCVEDNWMFLMQDFAQVCMKEPADFARLYGERRQAENDRQAAKLESERARIRAEEQAKAEHEAKLKADAEQDARDAETARQRALEQDRWKAEQAALIKAQLEAQATAREAERIQSEKLKQALRPKLAEVVIEHQDEISAFMTSRDFGKDAHKIRAALVEFVKFTESRNSHEQV